MPMLRLLAPLLLLLASGTAEVRAQSTYFADHTETFAHQNDKAAVPFALSDTTRFELRFVTDYRATCAIIDEANLAAFQAGSSVSTYALFNQEFGGKFITLAAGHYAVVLRNDIDGTNTVRFELDLVPSFPDGQFEDIYFGHSDYVSKNGGRLWQPFTITEGFRYWLDGANTGVDTYVIPADQLDGFRSGGSFHYYTDYSGTAVDQPGGYALSLPPGSYYLAFFNSSDVARAVEYTMYRFRIS